MEKEEETESTIKYNLHHQITNTFTHNTNTVATLPKRLTVRKLQNVMTCLGCLPNFPRALSRATGNSSKGTSSVLSEETNSGFTW